MGFAALSPSYNSDSRRAGFLGSLAPPFRDGLLSRTQVLGAFVVVENAVAAGRCLVDHFAPGVGTFDSEMAVPEAEITDFFVADEGVVLLRKVEARPLQSDDHRPEVGSCEALVSADRLPEDVAQFGPYRA